ncbi:MAG: S1C family serine protease [Coriobacteriia bacterium]
MDAGTEWHGDPNSPTGTDPHPPQRKRFSSAAVIITALISAVLGGLLVAGAVMLVRQPVQTGTSTGTSTNTGSITTITATGESVNLAVAVAQKVLPSVVNVTVMQQGVNQETGQQGLQEAGLGSGVVIRKDGYILTNYHVIADADEVVVKLGGAEQEVAEVVGTDPSSDLAVIKIEGTYTPIEVAVSKDVKVGQWVMACGSPFGLDRTVTTGIVSALQRSDIAQDQSAGTITLYTNLIQTDAAINPGNSGGALVDEQGKLIGITSLIESPSGQSGAAQSAGVGFAIPSDYAMDIAEQLISNGTATHPFMGISTQTVDQTNAAQDQPVKAGAVVTSVSEGSPAAQAGIRVDDIITKIGDQEITGVEDVFAAVRSHKVGDAVDVVLVRGSETMTIKVTLGSDANR